MNTETQKESRKQLKRCLFRWYSWAETLFWDLLDLFPPFLRRLLLKAMLAGVGKGTTIDYSTYIRIRKRFGSVVLQHNQSELSFSSFFWYSGGNDFNWLAMSQWQPEFCFLAAGHDYKTIRTLACPIRRDRSLLGLCLGGGIGANATVLQGRKHRRRLAVIGAGAVSHATFPPWTIAVVWPANR
jgi:hypothetical protein